MLDAVLTSLQNPKVKEAVRLHQRKYREETGCILIEGKHPLAEAQQAGLTLQTVFVRADQPLPAGLSCECLVASKAVMAKLSTTDTPVPMVGIAKRPAARQALFQDAVVTLSLGLVQLQDPGNLGTLVRSACAFGVQDLLIIGLSVDPYHPKIIRASAGLVFRLAVHSLLDLAQLAQALKAQPGMAVWGADAHQGESYRDAAYGTRNLVLLGGEAHGLPQTVWDFAQPIRIPMSPQAESLNVGVAGSIIMSEIFQQHQLFNPLSKHQENTSSRMQ